MASTAPCYRTGRTEFHPRKPIQIRRLNIAAVAAQIAVAQIVGKDQEKIRLSPCTHVGCTNAYCVEKQYGCKHRDERYNQSHLAHLTTRMVPPAEGATPSLL